MNTAAQDMLYEVADHIATITFNRPDQQNTISRDMLNRFSELLLTADADEDVRAIIITGTGKFFCAGSIYAQRYHHACGSQPPSHPPSTCATRRQPSCTTSTPTIAASTVPPPATVWTWL